MTDIRKRAGSKGVTYQVRYASKAAKSGYAYKSFGTLKEARDYVESGKARAHNGVADTSIRTVPQAIQRWLEICEKEGTDGNEPVTKATLENYEYFASFMKAYSWEKELRELRPPDIVEFRSWLLTNCPSRYLARKSLTCFHTVIREMSLRGHVASNVVSGVSISSSRYEQRVAPPTMEEFRELLAAADRLANSKNRQIARAWERYRPMLYLAGDTGMRPGEYLAVPDFNVSKTEVKVDRAIERGGRRISVTKTPAGWRWIDLSPETADIVMHYAKNHGVDNDHNLVFPTSTGGWQSIRNWRALGFAAACLEAGLVRQVENRKGETVDRPKYAPYDLRHFYASMLIEKRVNLKRIQKLMGHTDITTTLNTYGHLIERAEASEEQRSGLLARLSDDLCGKSVAGRA